MREEVLRMAHVIDAPEESSSLQYLSMQIFKGEIYGLLCLERHGLSKMVDLICHNKPLANGQVYFCEKLVNSPHEWRGTSNPVSIISRESQLIDEFSLADNLFVMQERFHSHIVPERAIRKETARLLKKLDIHLDPDTAVKELSAYHRIVLEVLKAVISGNKLIILWEISDLMGSEELPRFHKLLEKLAAKGNTFLYIYSHHEVLCRVCSRIAIFKGCTVQKVLASQNHIREQILHVYAADTYEKMQQMRLDKRGMETNPELLRLEHVSYGAINDLSLSIHRGENVLLLDQSNSIINDLVEYFWQMGTEQGTKGVPRKEGALRVSVLPRNPTATTLFPELSYMENLCFALAEKVPLFWQRSMLRRSVEREYREELGAVMKAPNLYGLSHRELYTLAYYRHLIAKPDLLVCVQPLAAMDTHLRSHILELLLRLQRSGIAVLVLNTELYDTLYIADRLVRVEKGTVTEEFDREHFEDLKLTHRNIYPD